MKKGLKALLIVLGILIVFIVFSVVAGTRNMGDIKEYVIPNIDMSNVADGDYEGSCDIGRWAITVNVTVKEHKITQVMIPQDQIPILPDEFIVELNAAILNSTDPNFDAVTGATISSKAYMIAVTDALSK